MHRASSGTELALAMTLVLTLVSSGRGDDFERLEGAALASAPSSDNVRALDGLSAAELGKLRSPFRDLRVPLILVRTSEGNLTRAVVAFAFRTSPTGETTAPVVFL